MVQAIIIGIPLVVLALLILGIFVSKAPGTRKGFSIAAIVVGVIGLAFGVYAMGDIDLGRERMAHVMSRPEFELQIATDRDAARQIRQFDTIVSDMKSSLPVGTALCAAIVGVGVTGLVRRDGPFESEPRP